jgi:hypothetical protein
MTQRFCEVCNDPLALESEESMCDSCLDAVEVEVGLMSEAIDAEEKKWETPAPSAEASSSSVTPDETSTEDKSMSGSFDALDAVSDMESGSLDSATPSSEASPSPSTSQKKEKKTEPCEACGTLSTELKALKHVHAKEPLMLCETCHASETALIEHANDPMQGKVVHPDEAAREELMTMDDADRILYNEEVMLSVESPIEMVYNRIALLEGRLQRAKLLLKASKTTLFMRIEHMKKDEREAEYRRLNERDATKRRRTAATSAPGVPGEKKKAAPRKTKAAAFRALMSAQGLPDEWIEEQIKKAGLE